MVKNSIKQLLMTSNFYVLNKTLVKKLGIETAFFLTTLVEADEVLADEDGWFYQTVPQIEEMTGLTKHKQNNCINELTSLGILLQENKGMPMKRYFKLDYEKISNILFSSSQKIVHQGSEKLTTKEVKNSPAREQKNVHLGGEKMATNKELNINNLNKKLNNKKSSSNIDNLDNNNNNSSTENNINNTTTAEKVKSLEDKNLKITDFYQEKLELSQEVVDFRRDVLELRELIATATGENIITIDMVFKPYLYTGIIKKVLEKIKASKFLSGKKERKPSLHIFVRKDKINEILAGLYDDFEEKPKTRPVEQESYASMLLRRMREEEKDIVEEVEYAR